MAPPTVTGDTGDTPTRRDATTMFRHRSPAHAARGTTRATTTKAAALALAAVAAAGVLTSTPRAEAAAARSTETPTTAAREAGIRTGGQAYLGWTQDSAGQQPPTQQQ